MDSRTAFAMNMDMSQMVATMYLEDLSDEDMLQRPHPECNHIKWQLGHLIGAEHMMMEAIAPGSMPALPEGFNDHYTKEKAKSDAAADFHSKEELLQVFAEQRAGTLAALNQMTDERLDEPAPEDFQQYAPTVGAVVNLQGSHWMMHAGQWAVIRRQLGRAPLF